MKVFEKYFEPKWTIGFDDLFKQMESLLSFSESTFPPHNIVKVENVAPDQFNIEIALAGYNENSIEVSVSDNILAIATKDQDNAKEDTETSYQYKGMANRKFTKKFVLSDSVEIGGATFENGMLTVSVVAKKPPVEKARIIPIIKLNPVNTDAKSVVGKDEIMFKRIAKFFAGPTEYERFAKYMDQATSREHVEWLERQWFKHERYK